MLKFQNLVKPALEELLQETPGIIPEDLDTLRGSQDRALSNAFAKADDTSLRWRKFATTFLNKLGVFFAAPSR
ncbi:unnamed protein product [Strongylus vulgaris]|uniref:Uncharacterized protein n=1 Tax=Strongylus vulgaris TaxID=40348 RepID=A0A3P7LU53_STRVU|nr:unnamed protein product [Strongylus vulgaris]